MPPAALLLQGCQPPRVLLEVGAHVQMFAPDAVRELDAATAHWVHFIPESALSDPAWPALRVRLAQANRCFLVFSEPAASSSVVRAMRDGAFDFVYTDEKAARWRDAVAKAAESQALWLQLYGGRRSSFGELFVGKSPAMEALRQTARRLGPTAANVLVVGESGTGKEKVANALHAESGLSGPFLAVNCAAIPHDLIEAELFGAEKGAFTGAVQARAGLVEQAAGGTLFLDEIGEMDISLQPKLLRFLETRRARRVGGKQEYAIDLRLVAATNRDLEAEIEKESFRMDLFYRLAEVVVKVPPLRKHAEDIPLLAEHFMNEANERFGKHFLSIEPQLLAVMTEYAWPGNIRELRATVHRLAILHDGAMLRREWWELPAARKTVSAPSPTAAPASNGNGHLNRHQKWQRAKALLRESGHDQTWTAAQLGVHPTTLFRWIKSGKV